MTNQGAVSRFDVRSFLNAGALVFAASMVLNVGGFAFHAVASRKLGVADYGSLYALISLYSFAIIPVALLTPVIAKFAAEFGALHDESHLRGLIELIARGCVFLGLAYVLVSVAVAVPVAGYFHVPWWEVPVVGVMAAVGMLSGTLRAIGQGVHFYSAYGGSLAAEGIVKVSLLFGFAFLGLTLFSGTGAFAFGLLAGAIFVAAPLIRRYQNVAPAAITLDWKRIVQTTAAAASLTLTLTFMGFGDVLIVKHFFSATDAGLYSATSLCARILLYFSGFIPAILIPQATHRHARGEGTRNALIFAGAFVCIVAIGGYLFYAFAPWLVLHALVGRAFDSALPLLAPYAAAMGALGVTTTLGSYAIATHRFAFVTPLLMATCVTLLTIALAHATLVVVVRELVAGNLLMLASVAAPLAIQSSRRRTA